MVKYCKFKESIAGEDKDGNKVIIFQKDETYRITIETTEDAVDDTGYLHGPSYFFASGLGIEKKYENKLYEVVEEENEI